MTIGVESLVEINLRDDDCNRCIRGLFPHDLSSKVISDKNIGESHRKGWFLDCWVHEFLFYDNPFPVFAVLGASFGFLILVFFLGVQHDGRGRVVLMLID